MNNNDKKENEEEEENKLKQFLCEERCIKLNFYIVNTPCMTRCSYVRYERHASIYQGKFKSIVI